MASDVVSFTPLILTNRSSLSRENWRRKAPEDYLYFNSYLELVRCLEDKPEKLARLPLHSNLVIRGSGLLTIFYDPSCIYCSDALC